MVQRWRLLNGGCGARWGSRFVRGIVDSITDGFGRLVFDGYSEEGNETFEVEIVSMN